MADLGTRIEASLSDFRRPRQSVQLGRAVIASAQMTLLVLTRWSNLVPEISGQDQAPVCRGLTKTSLFCIDPNPDDLYARLIIGVILLAVIVGVVPRFMSFLHFWASFSIASSIGLPDGGDQVAQLVSLLLIFINFQDRRWFAWKQEDESAESADVLVGVSLAGWWILRLQMAFIYAESGLSKLTNEDWVNGSALYYVVRDPSFGASGLVGRFVQAVTYTPVGTALLTWATIVAEITIAVMLLMGPIQRRRALLLVVALHIGIILVIGLWSFATIMIGAVLIAVAPKGRSLVDGQRERRRSQLASIQKE